jgi:hypothetical protein
MTRFRIDTEYHLPVYPRRFYAAATIEDACRMAISDEGWDDEQSDVDSSGDTYVADIREEPSDGAEPTYHPVPEAFRETVQRKADLFDDLVALLREPAREMGLSKRDFEDWLPRAQAVLLKADAIGT